jgi:putative Holliday junction resolvase
VRLLALDVGDVRIGVALSDETGTLASGLATLRAVGPRKDAQAVAALVREHGVGEVVVGLPLRLDGSLGPQGEKVLGFVERLRRVLRVPVVTRDERLTSVAADERLAEAGVKRRERRVRLDQAAAALILQELLDERKAVASSAGGPRGGRSPPARTAAPAGAGHGASSSRPPRSSAWPAPSGRRGGTRRGRPGSRPARRR